MVNERQRSGYINVYDSEPRRRSTSNIEIHTCKGVLCRGEDAHIDASDRDPHTPDYSRKVITQQSTTNLLWPSTMK